MNTYYSADIRNYQAKYHDYEAKCRYYVFRPRKRNRRISVQQFYSPTQNTLFQRTKTLCFNVQNKVFQCTEHSVSIY